MARLRFGLVRVAEATFAGRRSVLVLVAVREAHVPLELDAEPAPFGTLVGHVAHEPGLAAHRHGRRGARDLQGAQGDVSPGWYPTKAETGKVVPTWHYAVVHAYGRLRAAAMRRTFGEER